MRVRLHIDRLVLDGVDVSAADRPRLQAAVEGELARLVAAGGLQPPRSAVVVDAPPIETTPRAADLGARIAGSVYRGLGRSR